MLSMFKNSLCLSFSFKNSHRRDIISKRLWVSLKLKRVVRWLLLPCEECRLLMEPRSGAVLGVNWDIWSGVDGFNFVNSLRSVGLDHLSSSWEVHLRLSEWFPPVTLLELSKLILEWVLFLGVVHPWCLLSMLKVLTGNNEPLFGLGRDLKILQELFVVDDLLFIVGPSLCGGLIVQKVLELLL